MAVGGFVQGIVLEQALSERESSRVIALFFQQEHQPFQGIAASLTQVLAQGENPIIVAGGQQIACVYGNGGGKRRGGLGITAGFRRRGRRIQGGLKLGHIQHDRRSGSPLQRLRHDAEKLIGLGQRLAQPGEQRSEVFTCLSVRGIRPKGESQLLPGDGQRALQRQESQQML